MIFPPMTFSTTYYSITTPDGSVSHYALSPAASEAVYHRQDKGDLRADGTILRRWFERDQALIENPTAIWSVVDDAEQAEALLKGFTRNRTCEDRAVWKAELHGWDARTQPSSVFPGGEVVGVAKHSFENKPDDISALLTRDTFERMINEGGVTHERIRATCFPFYAIAGQDYCCGGDEHYGELATCYLERDLTFAQLREAYWELNYWFIDVAETPEELRARLREYGERMQEFFIDCPFKAFMQDFGMDEYLCEAAEQLVADIDVDQSDNPAWVAKVKEAKERFVADQLATFDRHLAAGTVPFAYLK